MHQTVQELADLISLIKTQEPSKNMKGVTPLLILVNRAKDDMQGGNGGGAGREMSDDQVCKVQV